MYQSAQDNAEKKKFFPIPSVTSCRTNQRDYGMHLVFETFSIFAAVKWGWESCELEIGILGRLPALLGKTAVPETVIRSSLSESSCGGFIIIPKGNKK